MLAPELAERLSVEEQTLRQMVRRLRQALAVKCQDRLEASIAEDEVVQNAFGKGYRLSPYLSRQPLAILTAGRRD